MAHKIMLYAGDEIQIKTKKGHFSGRIHLKNNDSIYLKEVVELNTGLSLPGLKSFHKNEVISSRFIRGCEKIKGHFEHTVARNFQAVRMFSNTYSSNSTGNHKSDDCDKELANLKNDQEFRMVLKFERLKQTLEDSKAYQGLNDLPETTHIDYETNSPVTYESNDKLNYKVIDSIDSLFCSSITDLKFSKYIGVAFIGSSFKRGTDFSWIAVHAQDFYLYDILSLGDSAFEHGLKDIFEDPGIVKVVYDCRVASHMLLCMHDSLLTNVLDLMAFDIMVESFSQPACQVPKSLTDLLTCIASHLNVSMFEVSSQRFRLAEARKNSEYWNIREIKTLPDGQYKEMIQAVVFEVAYLKQLKEALAQLIMKPVIDATDFFLGSLRDRSGLQLLPTDKMSTPKEFHDRSVLKHVAEKGRNKTAELMKRNNKNERNHTSVEIMPSKLYHDSPAISNVVSNESDTSSPILANSCTSGSSSSQSLDRKTTEHLFSKLREEKKTDQNSRVNFAPSGSESNYKRKFKFGH